jgi:hypothetical protein
VGGRWKGERQEALLQKEEREASFLAVKAVSIQLVDRK